MMMPSPPLLMDKSQQNQHHSLKCPRCDSSNTKFCYYNNYSLSQPRHFCKACKRYWTRGGTLRNVPVGGGCRKNKRVIKKPSSSISAIDSPNSALNPSNNNNNIINTSNLVHSSSSNTILSNPPLFYGVPTTSTDHHSTHLNLPSFQDFNSRVPASGFEGLGFLSGLMDYTNNNPIEFNFNQKEIQEVVNSSSVLSRYPVFGSSNLLQNQQKYMGFLPFEDMQMMGGGDSNGDGNLVSKDVKREDNRNSLTGTQTEHQIGSPDPSFLWSAPGVGSWFDPSSVLSLI